MQVKDERLKWLLDTALDEIEIPENLRGDNIRVYLREALRELKERREQSGWIKTAGQLPENGQFVLAYCCIDRPAYGLVEYTDFGEGLTCWTDPGTGNTLPIGMFTHWQPIERPYPGEDHKKDVRDYNLKMLTGQEWGREKLCQ